MITAPYSHTAKSRAILKAYNEAPTLGKFQKCFLTGRETTEFHVWKLNTPEGKLEKRVYIKNTPFRPYSQIIDAIEQKMLRDETKKLDYSTSEINLNFRIKVSGTRDGIKYNKLVGVTGLVKILGLELARKLINRAFNSQDDNIYCKLRTGLKITFYSK